MQRAIILVNGEIRVAKQGGPCNGKMILYLYTITT